MSYHLTTSKPFTWFLFLAICLWVPIVACLCCTPATTQTQTQLATQTCAQALAPVPQVQAQAAKLGIEPLELARRTCDTAILAGQLLQANLTKGLAMAGAPSSGPTPPTTVLGAAGSGG